MELVSTKLSIVLDTNSAARRENEKAVKELEKEISRTSENQVVEKVAYIWFNRFCALRFMDVNRYTSIGVVSPAEGLSQPEILMEAKQGHIDEGLRIDKGRVFGLLNETIPSPEPQQEAYRMLLVAVCNDYYDIMPFLFEKIADYTELLMPDDLLSDSSILTATREALSEEACADVEVIGWLYQFYISEKKDEVFAGLKKNKKVTPDNIPAATQLFTPNWIVRYLVENSLGRLWMLNNPGSRLIDGMAYYIKPEQEETDFLVIKSPEEIKICDPACGSGHMLVYAFEILYAIYEEQGYDAPKIPQLILANNLYGIEIDERAGELAAFALCMKAREKYRRFFKKNIQPNICVLKNVTFEPHEVKSYLDAVNPDLFTVELSTLLYQFKEADNFGSLIRPKLTNISDILRLIDEKKVADDMFLQGIHQRVLKVLKQADYLSSKYHVVVANPPYMGNGGMNLRLKTWLTGMFPVGKADLMTCFMEQAYFLLKNNGYWALINLPSWMFNSTFENLRSWLINKNQLFSMAYFGRGIFGSDFGSVAIVAAKQEPYPDVTTIFRKLFENHVDVRSPEKIRTLYLDKNYGWYSLHQKELAYIPGIPFAFWASGSIRQSFRKFPALNDEGVAASGIQTSNNERYLRFWHEVSRRDIYSHSCSFSEIDSDRAWIPHNKGGAFRRWYGNNDYVIAWHSGGVEAKNDPKFQQKNMQYQMMEAATWSHTSSGTFSVRFSPAGRSSNVEGPIFIHNKSSDFGLAFLASKVALTLMHLLNPTLHFLVGSVQLLPICSVIPTPQIGRLKVIGKLDWDSYETSSNFTISPLLDPDYLNSSSKAAYLNLRSHWRDMTLEMQKLEEENNRIFIEAYGFQNDMTPEVALREITLTCNPDYRYGKGKSEKELEAFLLADTMKELVSYSVGCMFGRYSLDKPGLILANQGETIENYLAKIPDPTFKPDDDNVIPIMDVDWFPDDIVERFKKFLKVTFGEKYYVENFEYIEKAIGKDIRKFFLKDFYTYHVKMYKKRPIYWMFSSPKGSFNALIYMHRYRPDTASIVLNDYLREFRTKLTARKDNLENISISTSASQGEKTKALKEIEQIKKVLDEVDDYERDILYPLATKQIEIDLDDGVKENYPKFGKALKKVAGLS